MSELIKYLKIFVPIWICGLFLIKFPATCADGRNYDNLSADQETVKKLIKEWSPLVWLAPGELYMPGDVTKFLKNVHAERLKASKQNVVETNDIPIDNFYYEPENNDFNSKIYKPQWKIRNMFEERNILSDYIIDLPIGEKSENWYLVTNENIDNLLNDNKSFVYGQNPTQESVPVYSVVNMCNPSPIMDEDTPNMNEINYNFNERMDPPINSRIIRIPTQIQNRNNYPYAFERSDEINQTNLFKFRNRRESFVENVSLNISTNEDFNVLKNPMENVESTKSRMINEPAERIENYQNKIKYPMFHVTYWMFYPYSQGKTICTLSLGPLGRLPIPLLFGMCLGSRRDFGSHIGDWEHMSLFFKGRPEPEEMYVSAHDAGAYYSYEPLTGSFNFRNQETRKGILQRPNFPKTVQTSGGNHPVLFSAQGSHGLWTAPGKHRFVRLPRLFDVNGFGTPWTTWKKIELSYQNERLGKTIGPEWLQYHGRWGNPQNKCHPLKRIGLNFCEYSDGPTGIPLKKSHFKCQA